MGWRIDTCSDHPNAFVGRKNARGWKPLDHGNVRRHSVSRWSGLWCKCPPGVRFRSRGWLEWAIYGIRELHPPAIVNGPESRREAVNIPKPMPFIRWDSRRKLSNLCILPRDSLLHPSSLTMSSISSRRGLIYWGCAARWYSAWV